MSQTVTASGPLAWEAEAERALKRVPFFVRKLVRGKVEKRVRERGGLRVTLADFQEAEARFRSVAAGKSPEQLEAMMPQANEAGAGLVVIETCHHDLSNCPNVLIDASAWKGALEAWAREREVSERLRKRVRGERVLYHHKLRFSISGCPNGCSRPQIADVGLVGFVRPDVDAAACDACGACAEACPDRAIRVDGAPPCFDRALCQGCLKCRDACPVGCIRLSEPGVRVLVGGKLGRHPRLAQVYREVSSPEELVPILDDLLESFLQHARPGERFADFWARRHEIPA